jgi:hypothetical protein
MFEIASEEATTDSWNALSIAMIVICPGRREEHPIAQGTTVKPLIHTKKKKNSNGLKNSRKFRKTQPIHDRPKKRDKNKQANTAAFHTTGPIATIPILISGLGWFPNDLTNT